MLDGAAALAGVAIVSARAEAAFTDDWMALCERALQLEPVVDAAVVVPGRQICGLALPPLLPKALLPVEHAAQCRVLASVKVRIARPRRMPVAPLPVPAMCRGEWAYRPSLPLEPTVLYHLAEVAVQCPAPARPVPAPWLPSASLSNRLRGLAASLRVTDVCSHGELPLLVLPEYAIALPLPRLTSVLPCCKRALPCASVLAVPEPPELRVGFDDSAAKMAMVNLSFLHQIELVTALANAGWAICERATRHASPTLYLAPERYVMIVRAGQLQHLADYSSAAIVVVMCSEDGFGSLDYLQVKRLKTLRATNQLVFVRDEEELFRYVASMLRESAVFARECSMVQTLNGFLLTV